MHIYMYLYDLCNAHAARSYAPWRHVGGGKWPGDEAKTMPCTFIGASLSEPHTSVTALLDARVYGCAVYVCVWPYTEILN